MSYHDETGFDGGIQPAGGTHASRGAGLGVVPCMRCGATAYLFADGTSPHVDGWPTTASLARAYNPAHEARVAWVGQRRWTTDVANAIQL